MNDAVRMLGTAVAVVLLFALLRQYQPQMVPLFSVAAAVVLAVQLLGAASGVLGWITALELTGVEKSSSEALLKAACVLLCSDWCKEFCKESGMNSLASGIELAGRCFAFSAAYPLFQQAYTLVMRLMV